MSLAASIQEVLGSFPYLAAKYRDVPPLLLLPASAAAVRLMARRLGSASRWLTAAAVIVACGVTVFMLMASVGYLAGNGYLDHVEASVAAVSWWYRTGHPLYPDWAESVYGFQYGPLLFQITAAALLLGPSILVSKLPGFGAFWLACAVVAGSLRPVLPSARQSLLPMAVVILVAGGYWRAAYWVRGDPYLLLFAALALCAWLRLRPVPAALGIGMLGGGIVNLKIHGILYILPYAVALLASQRTDADRTRTAITGIAAALAAASLPFLDPNVSLANYVRFIDLALHHGLDRPLLLLNIRFSLVLLLPALILGWRHWRGQIQPDLLMGLVYCLCVAAVCVVGAKKGAGPTHLLPFLPAFALLLARVAQSARIPDNDAARSAALASMFLAVAIAYLPSFGANFASLRAWVRATDNPAFRQEAAQIYRDYPTAVMGAGDGSTYALTEYKTLGVFAGGPLVFDATTWMDLQGAGITDEVVDRLLIDCRTRFWIVPNGGTPFTQAAAYSPEPLFSDRFRQLFQQGYSPVRVGEFYSVWACRDAPADR